MAAGHEVADARFVGVPMLIKDASIEVDGTPYFIGTSVLRDTEYRSRRTTELARRLARAGFIFLGKSNVPELSAGITTEPAAFAPTRNPWDIERTAGGSSGGSAAAVAAGMVALAHGADGTGSLRYPAACCGVVTLKPSRGLVPSETPAGQPDSMRVWSEFVLGRTVRDLAGVLDAVADGSPGAMRALAAPAPTLRVGLLERDVMSGMEVDPACADAVRRCGALLSRLGHEVEDAHPPALDGWASRMARPIGIAGLVARAAQVRWLEGVACRSLIDGDLLPDALRAGAATTNITPASVHEAEHAIAREAAGILEWWAGGFDMLVTPVTRQPAWSLGSTGGALDSGIFPPPFSFTGQPAASVPMGLTEGGLPLAVQVVGGSGQDALVLRLAAQIEEVAPWANSWPAIAQEVSPGGSAPAPA